MCNLNDPGGPSAGSKSRDALSLRTLAALFHGCADFETIDLYPNNKGYGDPIY